MIQRPLLFLYFVKRFINWSIYHDKDWQKYHEYLNRIYKQRYFFAECNTNWHFDNSNICLHIILHEWVVGIFSIMNIKQLPFIYTFVLSCFNTHTFNMNTHSVLYIVYIVNYIFRIPGLKVRHPKRWSYLPTRLK